MCIETVWYNENSSNIYKFRVVFYLLFFMCPRHEIALAINPGIKNKGLYVCLTPDWYKSSTTNQVFLPIARSLK